MSDTVFSAIVGAIALVVVAAIGFYANYKIERFKQRNTANEVRLKAYANWFTTEALMHRRMQVVCEKLVGFLRDHERHESLVAEIKLLTVEVRTLIASMNEAFLIETDRRVRKILATLSDFLARFLGDLNFAADHYGENIEFHEIFEKTTDDEISTLPLETRRIWEETKEKFKKHDAKCPFKSDEFRDNMEKSLDWIHEQAITLREAVASKLSN